ncbi:Uncharacterised protein [Vibrio cholerae]|nr:Uncharacterised protein [Vibrio cholerae]
MPTLTLTAPESADGLPPSVPPAKAEEVEKTNAVVISRDDFFIVYPYELVECVIEELGVKRCRQRCQRWR